MLNLCNWLQFLDKFVYSSVLVHVYHRSLTSKVLHKLYLIFNTFHFTHIPGQKNKTKQHHMKVPLSSFIVCHNLHTLRFHLHTEKLDHLLQYKNSTTCTVLKVLLSSFHLNGHTLGFHPQAQKVWTTLYSIINSTLCSSFHFELSQFCISFPSVRDNKQSYQ